MTKDIKDRLIEAADEMYSATIGLSNFTGRQADALDAYAKLSNEYRKPMADMLDRLNKQQDFVGCAELAYVYGISTQGMSMKHKRGGFLAPKYELAMGPVWDKKEVKKYILDNANKG